MMYKTHIEHLSESLLKISDTYSLGLITLCSPYCHNILTEEIIRT